MPRYEVRNIWRREDVYVVEAGSAGEAGNRWRDGDLVDSTSLNLVGQEIKLLRAEQPPRDDDPVHDG